MELKTNCAKYIASLRSLYLLHQQAHWMTNGSSSYAYHLLFERIYKTAAENADLAAEKFIGVFGREFLGVEKQSTLIQELLGKYSTTSKFVEHSLQAEKDFLKFSQEFYNELKAQNKMTLGVDDAIMSIASDRETAVYLLKQSLVGGDDMNKMSALAKKFQIKLAQVAAEQEGGITPGQFQQKLQELLTINLGNRNWGEVGFNSLIVSNANGVMTVNFNLIIPANSPPFTDKRKYPQGLNQFKQEMMDIIAKTAQELGIQNLVQIIKVNGK